MRRSALTLLRGVAARTGVASATEGGLAAAAALRCAAPQISSSLASGQLGAQSGMGAVQQRSFASDADDFDDLGIIYPPAVARVGAPAPGFTCGGEAAPVLSRGFTHPPLRSANAANATESFCGVISARSPLLQEVPRALAGHAAALMKEVSV